MESAVPRERKLFEIGISAVVLVLFASIYGWLFWQWVAASPADGISKRVPGMDRRAEILAKQGTLEEKITIGQSFLTFDGKPSAITAAWPRFRGAHFDNISSETVPLNDKWPSSGPPVLWSVELGEGYAAPAVRHGRVYLIDYMEASSEDALRCFSLDDGKEIWRRSYRILMKRNHGYSRTVPAVSDKYVVTFGPRCHVMCVDAITGDLLWGMDLVKDYGATVPLWYAGQCPLIDDDIAVIGIGGDDLVQGIDCATGDVVFRVPNPDKWQMSHSSIVPAVIDGKRMYVYAAVGGTCGISAEKADLGKVLWKTTDWDASVIAPTPVVMPDGRIHMTAGYGAGSIMLQVRRDGDSFSVKTLFKKSARDMLACEQQTPIYYKGNLYGVMPKDGGSLANQFVCYNPDGQLIWASGKARQFGIGPFMAADNKFLVLDDDGRLTMMEASDTEYKELAHAKPLDGHDSWGPMALVDGRLLIRDSERMVCLDLRSNTK